MSKFEIERPSPVDATTLGLALSRKLVRLLDREREKSCKKPEREECEDDDEARRWRIRLVGSTSGILATTANRERTGSERVSNVVGPLNKEHPLSTIETMPHRLPVLEMGFARSKWSLSVTKRRWELAVHEKRASDEYKNTRFPTKKTYWRAASGLCMIIYWSGIQDKLWPYSE